MARYVLIRGWLECSFDDVAAIKDLINQHWETSSQYHIPQEAASLYQSGWTFPATPLNWTSLIFYGADVRAGSVAFIFDGLSKIAKADIEINGLFHVDDEEGESPRLWTIKNQTLLDIPRLEAN